MVGLHVQLDVEYASDEKLIDAGALAELLYVRGLCFAKKTLKDGRITHGQLATVAIGIPSPVKRAQDLVRTGAWTARPDGYQITSWLKRNKSAATVKAESARKTREALERNHKRWHVDEKKLNPTCPLCYPEADPLTDQSTDQSTDPVPESTEVETEEEAYPEEEEEVEEETTSSSSLVTQPGSSRPPDDDEFVSTVIKNIAGKRTARGATSNPIEYMRTTLANLERERSTITAMLAELPHLSTDHELAASWYETTWKLRVVS